jgi:hypothetical protein
MTEVVETQPTEKRKQPLVNANIIWVLAALAFGWYFYGGGLEKQAAQGLKDIQNQVASDSVEQYGIAARSGSDMDRCVQAGLVTAAFLQAKDEINYAKWKDIESNDCNAAGVPR